MKRLIEAEWMRLWYPRFTVKYIAAILVCSLLFALALTLSTPLTQNRPFEALSEFEVVSVMLLSLDLASILLIVFSAIAVGTEFSSGSMRATLLAVPQRGRLMFAKCAALMLFALIIAVAVVVFALLTAEALLLSHGAAAAPLARSDFRNIILGSVLMPVFYAAMASGFAFMTGRTGGAITVTLLVMLLPAAGNLMEPKLKGLFLPLLPSSAIHSLAGIAEGAERLPGVVAALLLLAWTGACLFLGGARFRKHNF